MEDSGGARSVALKIMRLTGDKSQFYILLAIALLCTILTLGGVSLFVVIFAIMPIARPLFRRMNIPLALVHGRIHARQRRHPVRDDPGQPIRDQHHADQVP